MNIRTNEICRNSRKEIFLKISIINLVFVLVAEVGAHRWVAEAHVLWNGS